MSRLKKAKLALWYVFWRGEMKYGTTAQIAAVLIAGALYLLSGVLLSVVTLVTMLLGIQFCMHAYWMYESMRDSEDFEHNPVYGAVVGVFIMYILATVAAVVVAAVLIAASIMTGLPIFIPGLLMFPLAYLLYVWWK